MTEESKKLEAAKEYLKEVKDFYDSDPRQQSFNMLLLGEYGTGKTLLSHTARLPVHIDSFDPGGTKSVLKWIKQGDIIADTRWEGDDPMKPNKFSEWKQEMKHRKRIGYFDHLGTFMLDSGTIWSEAIMNDVLKKAGRAGDSPKWAHDYVPQKTQISNWIRFCLELPCDFILTGHLEQFTTNDGKDVRYRFMTTGKGAVIIPLLFDEIWVMIAEAMPNKQPKRYVLTTNIGMYAGRTRIGGEQFDLYEEPNIKKLLKKAGLPSEDKPSL